MTDLRVQKLRVNMLVKSTLDLYPGHDTSGKARMYCKFNHAKQDIP